MKFVEVDREKIIDFGKFLDEKIIALNEQILKVENTIDPIATGKVWNGTDAKSFKKDVTSHINDLKAISKTLQNCSDEISKNGKRYFGALNTYSNRAK